MDIGKFEVIEPLGRGAGSTILKIRRLEDRKLYALKVVSILEPEDKKYVDQVEWEYEVGSKLDHPRLLGIYGFEQTKKLFRVTGARLLMEYVPGRPLADTDNLSMIKQLGVFVKVADGLAYMHRVGYYHADIKPENIMIDEEGHTKVIDFGLAWREGEPKNRVQGTLEFLAPEQANDKIVNGKTDIFNLGATMYRVFTGQPVPKELRETGVTAIGTLDNLVKPVSKLNREIPDDLDELIRQCVKVKPDERPATMRELRDRLIIIGKRLKAQS